MVFRVSKVKQSVWDGFRSMKPILEGVRLRLNG